MCESQQSNQPPSEVPRTLENFYPCPVCVGIPLQKLRFQKRDGTLLILDHCQRCQGMWFDHREVNLLRQMPPHLFTDKVQLTNEVFMMPCHRCHQLTSRDLKACMHCKHPNTLDCPVCQKTMQVKNYAGFKLDICRQCRGVWFDSHELVQLWQVNHRDLPGAPMGAGGGFWGSSVHAPQPVFDPLNDVVDMWIALEVLEAAPEIAMGIANVAGGLAEASSGFISEFPELLASTPELLGAAAEMSTSAIEGLAEIGGSIFELISEILGGIFD